MKFYKYAHTKIGKLLLLAQDNKLIGIYAETQKNRPDLSANYKLNNSYELFNKFTNQLDEYLCSKRELFDVPYQFDSGTDFQRSVWTSLANIKFGQVTNYSEISISIGKASAVRAVANAIGKNPLLILVPCHRVIGKDNKLRGFAAGINLKKELLLLEQKIRGLRSNTL